MMNIRSRVIPGTVLILSITLSSVALPVAVGADDEDETGSGVSVDGIAGVSDGVEGGEPAQGTSTGDLNDPLGGGSGGNSAGSEGAYRENTTSTDDGDDSQQGRADGDTAGGTTGGEGSDPAEGGSSGTSAGSKDSATSGSTTGADGRSGSASTGSKKAQPMFELMAMLILSDAQDGGTKGSEVSTARSFRDLVTALEAIGYLREGASDRVDVKEAAQLFKALMETPPGGSSTGTSQSKDEDD